MDQRTLVPPPVPRYHAPIMRPFIALAALLAFVVPPLGAAGCAHSHEAGVADTGLSDAVVYQGGATDEALAMLLGTGVKPGGAVLLAAPTTGICSVSSADAFRWTLGSLASRPAAEPATRPSFFGAVAHAHGVALTGSATFVRFLDDKGAVLAQAFTTALGYNLSNTDRTAMEAFRARAGAPGAIMTVELTAARFESNRVVEGPFRAPLAMFTLSP